MQVDIAQRRERDREHDRVECPLGVLEREHDVARGVLGGCDERFAELDLARKGDELVLTVAGYRRVLALPAAMARTTVEAAELTDGRLTVRFTPVKEQ